MLFIARDGEQISWVSNYLFHLLSAECIIPQLEFYIYITLEKELKSLPSFLFWRAFLLLQNKMQACRRDFSKVKTAVGGSEEKPASVDQQDPDSMETKYVLSPVKVLFGRPDFVSLFKSFITPTSKKFHVYSTTSPQVNSCLFDATLTVTKETKVNFHHIYEATS